jgi:hypothetical protein
VSARLCRIPATAVAAVLLVACGHSSGSGGSSGAPTVAGLTSKLGCTHVEQNTEVIGVREEASCDLGADRLTIDTYVSNEQRDVIEKTLGQLAGGVTVVGDRWTVLAPTQASAEAVGAKIGGEIK